jgi:hypothetical protein
MTLAAGTKLGLYEVTCAKCDAKFQSASNCNRV